MRKTWKPLLLVLLSLFLLAGCAGETEEEIIPESVEILESEAEVEPEPEPAASPNVDVPFETTAAGGIIVPDDPTDLIQFLETFAFEGITISLGEEDHLSLFPSIDTVIRLELFYEASGIYFDPMEMRLEGTIPLLFADYFALDEEVRTHFYQLIAESER